MIPFKKALPALGIFGAVSAFSVVGGGEDTESTKIATKVSSPAPSKPNSANVLQETKINTIDEKTSRPQNKEVQELTKNIDSSASLDEVQKPSLPSPVISSHKEDAISKQETTLSQPSSNGLQQIQNQLQQIQATVSEVVGLSSGLGATITGKWDFSKIPSSQGMRPVAPCIANYFVEGAEGTSKNDGLKTFTKKTEFKEMEDLFKGKKLKEKFRSRIGDAKNRCSEINKYLYVWVDKWDQLNFEAKNISPEDSN